LSLFVRYLCYIDRNQPWTEAAFEPAARNKWPIRLIKTRVFRMISATDSG
jgi:hypothetical protein